MGLFIKIYDIAIVLVCMYFVGRAVLNYFMKRRDGTAIVSLTTNEDKQMRLFLTIVSCGLMTLLSLTYFIGLIITSDIDQMPVFLISLLLAVIFYFLFNGKYEIYQSGFFTAFSFYRKDRIVGYGIKREGAKAFISLKLASGKVKRLAMAAQDKGRAVEMEKGLKELIKGKKP